MLGIKSSDFSPASWFLIRYLQATMLLAAVGCILQMSGEVNWPWTIYFIPFCTVLPQVIIWILAEALLFTDN